MRAVKERVPLARLAATLAVVALAALYLKHGTIAAEAVRRGLSLCAGTMIPSLFPFMVIAELIVRSGAGGVLARPISRTVGRVLAVSESGCCALVLGFLCGFPIGAKVAASYYRSGAMDERELGRVVAASSVPSAAFLLGAVGEGLLGSAAVGRALLCLALCSALLVGGLSRFAPSGRSVHGNGRPIASQAMPSVTGGALLPHCISSAASGMLGVCATVVIFTALIGVLEPYARAIGLSETASALLSGVLELSTGTAHAATLLRGDAAMLCAAMVGWGGLSVHCQILAVCDGCPVALGRFWLSRAAQALLCGSGMWLLIKTGILSLADASVSSPVGRVEDGPWQRVWQAVCLIGFLAALAVLWINQTKGGGAREAKKAALATNTRGLR